MKRTLSLGAAGVLLTVGLVGCGPEKESAPKENGVATMNPSAALRAADEATADLTDAVYSGPMTDPGLGKMSATSVTVVGHACSVVAESRSGARIELRQVGRTLYLKVNRKGALWLGFSAAQAGAVVDKWLSSKVSAKDRGRCETSSLVPRGKARSTFKAGKISTIEGQEARSFTGRDSHGDKVTLWIATMGDPLVVRVHRRNGETSETLTLQATDIGSKVVKPSGEIIRVPN